MRFAFIVEPSRGDSADRLAPLREKIGRAGFNIVRLPMNGALTRDLARAVDATDEGDAALVYIAGDVELDGDSISLVGETPVDLATVATIASNRGLAQMAFVVDARCEGTRGDALLAAEHAEAIVNAVGAKELGAELLAAVEVASLGSPPSFALTRFFGIALDDQAALAEDGTMRMSSAYAKMRANPEFGRSVPSFAHVQGASDFLMVAPTKERVSDRPPSYARVSGLPSSPRVSAPPSMRSGQMRAIVALPAIGPILAEAEQAQASGEWDRALDGYRKALMVLGDGSTDVMASLYASVAEVKLAQGKPREAEASFEKALAAVPTHTRSLGALAKMAAGAKEYARAATFERRLARAKGTDAAKVDALLHVAARYANDVHDAIKAGEVLDEARGLDPKDPRILQASRAVYEATRQWKKLAEVLGAMADAQPLLHDQAQRRFEQADVLLGRLRDEPAGIAVLELALSEDPTHEKSLAALFAVYTRKQEWRALETLYAKLVERYAQREDSPRAWEACKRLGQHRRDKLHDGPGALDAFYAALQLRPRDVETRAALAELLIAKNERPSAIVELETCARYEPLRAETYRRLFELHRRLGDSDRAWLAATALETLGAGNVDSQVLADQFRGDPPRATAVLDDASWERLRASGADDVVEHVLIAVAPVAIARKLDELRAAKKLVALDPKSRQPADSTATIVRTFAVASHVLGVKPPELYVLEDVQEGLAAVQAPEPSTVLGGSVMRNRTLAELAFFAGRHLVYYRPEHYPLVFFPTLPELTALFLAAVKLVRPALPIPTHASAAAGAIRKELAAHATEAQKAALSAAVERLDVRGGKVDLAAWMRGVEMTATRVGMLLAGDLAVAVAAMKGEPRAVAELSFDDRRADLLAFTASRGLAETRAHLGMAVRVSLPPPPASAARLPVA